MKGYTVEDEYALQKLTDAHYKVLKFCGHHGNFLTAYDIVKNKNSWLCDCPAPGHCKHIDMILDSLKPVRKSLF
jgi:hypothetical protein